MLFLAFYISQTTLSDVRRPAFSKLFHVIGPPLISQFPESSPKELEYLAVYGRASMAAFRQLSTHGQKFDRESLYEPI